ncbi:hypothetical protein PV327_008855 [Microctonus hyperodae]|uniref:Uncharacterized protein n=1 Tax=Microctonus hyperodae TaxID=165561 RepID=A0AA39FT18_MICHY|nr:hypothetical protein PV327_008855 [Microctonus hyperodae]
MKHSDLLKILIVLATVLLIVDGRHRGRKYGKKRRQRIQNSDNNFDLLIFTQHWPQTVCYMWKEEYVSHTCLLPTNEEWTIHGIWPTQMGKEGPSYCNNASRFDSSALSPIEDDLKTKWLDVENGTAHYSFWKHEWYKHGTCAMVIPSINNELKYFTKGIELLDTYDMKYVLAKANILPNNHYKVQEILDGVEKILGKRGQVECIVNPKTKERYLFEVRICFDKSFNLINCDGIANFPTNCSKKKNIIYPSSVPDSIKIIQI